MTAPRVFVASSSEQLAVARAVAAALERPGLEARVWDEETSEARRPCARRPRAPALAGPRQPTE